MNVRNLLIVNAVYVTLIALVSILAPERFLDINGLDVTDATINLQRAVGAVAIGYGITSWLMRNVPTSEGRRAFLLGAGVSYFIVAAVFVLNKFTSELGNSTVWVYVVISLLLGIDFIFFGLQETASE